MRGLPPLPCCASSTACIAATTPGSRPNWSGSECGAAAGKVAVATPEMAALIGDAQRLSAAGDALFDPGIGGLIRLWGFQADDFKAVLPDPAAPPPPGVWRSSASPTCSSTVCR